MRRSQAIAAGAVVGAVPGAILVVLTIPVSGEIELTLGVAGILLAFIGMAIGAWLAARKR